MPTKAALPTTPQALFLQFLAEVYAGNRSAAARDLGVNHSLITRICNGERAITPPIARRIEQLSAGRFRKAGFIWEEETRAAAVYAGAMRRDFR